MTEHQLLDARGLRGPADLSAGHMMRQKGFRQRGTVTDTLGQRLYAIDAGQGFLDGNEIDLYAQWVVNEHLVLSPLVGFYTPDKSAAQGGTQIGNDDTNIYSQVIAIVNF